MTFLIIGTVIYVIWTISTFIVYNECLSTNQIKLISVGRSVVEISFFITFLVLGIISQKAKSSKRIIFYSSLMIIYIGISLTLENSFVIPLHYLRSAIHSDLISSVYVVIFGFILFLMQPVVTQGYGQIGLSDQIPELIGIEDSDEIDENKSYSE